MADKQATRSTRRGQLVRQSSIPKTWHRGLLDGLDWVRTLIGLVFVLVLTLLLMDFSFQRIPNYEAGDIADRTVVAPSDYTVLDVEATEARRQEAVKTVPAVFQIDPRRSNRVISEMRSGFGYARELLSSFRKRLGLSANESLPSSERKRLIDEIQQSLPSFGRRDVLEVLLKQGFSADLEEEMVGLIQSAMEYPGVIGSRDMLLINSERGIVLVNSITRREEAINDWMTIRDHDQAIEMLRQNQYRLTAVDGMEKKVLIEFLDNWIIPNVYFDETETLAREELARSSVPPVLLQIKKGRILIRAGDEVAVHHIRSLEGIRRVAEASHALDRFFGLFLLVSFFVYCLWRYLLQYQERNQDFQRYFLLISLVLVFNLALARLLVMVADLVSTSLSNDVLRDPVHLYFVVPMAVGAILVTLLLGARFCVLYTIAFSVLVALMTGELAMAVFALVGCLTAIYALTQYRERSAIVRAGLIVGVVNVIAALCLQLYSTGFVLNTFMVRSALGFLGGLFAAMLAAPLLPALESLFDITTDIRLLELSNLNSPILRRLAAEAPGTYHHSIIVGTLAEAAAEAIGANPLLTRVGAYYHDIGKLRKPDYYVENQVFMANKHENLSPHMSSLILASHVKDGLAMAEEINLAPRVRDLIPQHHGTKLMTFFYQKARQCAEAKEREINEEDFRYPGPKPRSREAAILMLADQVEAASRTLQDPNPRQVRALIRRLIQATIEDRQFDECDITTRDLEEITRAFERVISGIYHHRIEYPGFDFNRQPEREENAPDARPQPQAVNTTVQ